MQEKISTKDLRRMARGFGISCKSDNFDMNKEHYRKDWEALSYIRCELLKRKLKSKNND
jgi:hypothetical protein